MNRKSLSLLFMFMPVVVFAQEYEKNNLPCLPELCIGDGLPELGKIKWDRAKSDFSITGKPDYVGSHPLSATAIASVKDLYRGDLTKSAPYLSYQAFDGSAIPLLGKVAAACVTQELRGTFTSQDGNPTTVKIALLSDKNDTAIQRWTVVTISRNFPAAVSDAQKKDIRKQLDERYGRFSVSHGIQRGINAAYNLHDNPQLPGSYGFSLLFNVPVSELDRKRQHPACGGMEKMSIN